MKLLRLTVLFLLVYVLYACSAIKPAYNNADTLLYFWLDGYVDINLDQKVRVKDELLALQNWHRQTQLPAYAKLAKEWQAFANKDISAQTLCSIWEQQIKPLQTPITTRLEPSVLWLSTQLTPEQINYLNKAYDKATTKWQKEWMPAKRDDLIKHTVKTQKERLENLYGPLSEQQQAVLREAAMSSPFDGKTALTQRLVQQQDILNVLREIRAKNLSEASAKPLLLALLTKLNAPSSAAYVAYAERVKTHHCALFAKLHNGMNALQRQHLQTKLADYAADFETLSKTR